MIEKKIIQTNYTPGRGGKSPKYVVMHTFGAKGRSLYTWFNNPNAQVSAHYGIFKDGNGEQYVEESDTAWHAGVFAVNQESIGIEHQDDGVSDDLIRTIELYETSAQLIAEIYKRYGWDIENQGLIKLHREFVPSRSCPGGLDIARIRQRVYDILHNQNNDMTQEQFEFFRDKLEDIRGIQNTDLNRQAEGFESISTTLKDLKVSQEVNEQLRTELVATKEAKKASDNSNLLLKDDLKRANDEIAELKKSASAKFTQLIGPLFIRQS